MAKNISVSVFGGAQKTALELNTVKDAYNALGLSGNYTATVNGDPADLNQELNDYEFVSFTQALKGGRI